MIPVRLIAAAEADARKASHYYNRQVRGLGRRFMQEVFRGVARIGANPQIGTPTRKGARRLLLHKFPYSLIYRVQPEHAYVLAVAHQRRREGFWEDRKEPLP